MRRLNKQEKIEKIVISFKKEIDDMFDEENIVKSIYKEIINEEFCSNYGIKAPLSSFSKNGPHIFFEVNNKIGFGMYIEDLSFNKGLYEEGGKFWAEILSPDFFVLFSSKINEAELINSLFQMKKDRLLSAFGWDYAKNKVKHIPLIIYKTEDSFLNLTRFNSNETLLEVLSNIEEFKIDQDIQEISLEAQFYIAGNSHRSNEDELIFSNRIRNDSEIMDTVLDLKFFNNIRDLERKLSENKKEITKGFKIDAKNENFVFPDIRIKLNMTPSKIKKLNKDEIMNSSPILRKTFLKGFFDRHFIYNSDEPYSGEACLENSSIDSVIKQLIISLGGKVLPNEIIVDNSFLEVRRMPFCSGRFILI